MADLGSLPKMTDEQCALVISWFSALLAPWDDVFAYVERPEVQQRFTDVGEPYLFAQVKDIAKSSTVAIGGGNGGMSWKPNPRCIDIDIFAVISSSDLTAVQTSQLRFVFNKRVPEEFHTQRERCTIPGVELQQGNLWRRMDTPKLGIRYNGTIWPNPGRCRHCGVEFNDGKFCVHNGTVVHESCLSKL